MIFAIVVFLFSSSLIRFVQPATLTVTPVSTTTATSGDSFLNSTAGINSHSTNFTANSVNYNLVTYAASSTHPTEPNIKVFTTLAEMKISLLSDIQNVSSVVIKDNALLLSSNMSADKQIYDIQVVAQIFAASSSFQQTLAFDLRLMYSIEGSSLVLMGGTTNRVRPFDLATRSLVGTEKTYVYGLYGVSRIEAYGSQYFFIVFAGNAFYIVDRSTLDEVKFALHPYTNYNSVLDNLNADRYFYFGSGLLYVASLSMASIEAGTTQLIPPAAEQFLISKSGNNLLNFGPYDYLMIIPSTAVDEAYGLTLINKSDFTLTLSIRYEFSTTIGQMLGCYMYSLQGLFPVNEKFYFSFIDRKTNNLQAYYMIYDICFSRDTSRTCLKCFIGYSRLGQEPDGECISDTLPIPDGYGKVIPMLPDPLLMKCTQPGCLKCAEDNSLCTQCGDYTDPITFAVTAYYLRASTCITTAQMNDYQGPELTLHTVIPCSIADCITCNLDHLKCLKCDKTKDKYRQPLDSTCILAGPAMPATFGPDLLGGEVVKCTELNCINCNLDHSRCTACDTTISYFIKEDLFKCWTFADMTTGLGPNLSTGKVTSCDNSFCLQCSQTHLFCTQCDFSRSAYLYPTDGKCYLPGETTIPNLKGPDPTNQIISGCLVPHCLKCTMTITECEACDSTNGYYLYVKAKTCLIQADIPAGYGADDANGLAPPCAQPKCIDCRADFKKCWRCDVTQRGCLNKNTLTCIDFENIPDLFGCNLQTTVIGSCRNTGCMDCRENRFQCKKCNPQLGYYFENETCFDIFEAPLRKGINNELGIASPCTVDDCLLCRNDYRYCTMCDMAKRYELLGDKCIKRTDARFLQIKRVSNLITKAKVVVKFDADIEFNATYIPDLTIKLVDLSNNTVYDNRSIFEYTPLADGFEVFMNITTNIFDGQMTIDIVPHKKKDLQDKIYLIKNDPVGIGYSQFPIVIPNVLLFGDENMAQVVQTGADAMTSLSSAQAGVTLALIQSNPGLAVLLDKIMCDLSYLSIMVSEKAYISNGVAALIEDSKVVPFVPNNPFKNWIKLQETACHLGDHLESKDLNCGLLFNYGKDLVFLIAIFSLNLIMTGLGMFRPKLKRALSYREKNTRFRLVKRLFLKGFFFSTTTFSVRYFMLKMEGNIVEIVIFTVLNFYTMSNSLLMWVGAVISLLLVGYYVFYGYSLLVFSRQLYSELKYKQPTKSSSAGELLKAYDVSKLKFGKLLIEIFDGYKYPLSPASVYVAYFSFVRYVLVAVLVVVLGEKGVYLPLSCGTVELLFFVYVTVASVKESRLENWVEQFNSFIVTLFAMLSALSFLDISRDQLQIVDLCLVFAMIALVAVNTFVIIFALVLSLYELIANRTCLKPYDYHRYESIRILSRIHTTPLAKNRQQILKLMMTDPDRLAAIQLPSPRKKVELTVARPMEDS